MPSESKTYLSRKYGPPKQTPNDAGTNTGTSNYGPGSTDHHPKLPVTPDFRDDTRAAEPGGLRSRYDIRNWTQKVDQAALHKIRNDIRFPGRNK